MQVFNMNDAPPDAEYIGRGTPYGNPYIIGKHGTRNEVCDMFIKNVLPTLDVAKLVGKNLKCHCKPKRCHGDAIINKIETERFSQFICKG